ncbi:hypothetical protein B0H16DRAFT_1757990 [Mycena metata]|uniref:Uncharacterized protein n=1 Tax=Mycena metata TaxID=1033252 RepID=A0AAD7ICZ3_9AGAR|nr:hypothetical protein B0H16DRAFT_1757990 [Mycena metata]
MAIVPGNKEAYIGAFLESIYLSTFAKCCRLFWLKHKTQNIKHVYLLITTGLMFVLITMQCVLQIMRCIMAFDHPDLDFGPPNIPLGVISDACWFFLTPIADAFIIYRTFVIWNRNLLIILLPAMLSVANSGSSIWLTVTLSTVNTATMDNITVKPLDLFLSLTLCTNVICTGLISFRIWYIHRLVAQITISSEVRTLEVVSIIIESAAIYTLLLTTTLIIGRLNILLNFVLFACISPTIGVVFSYIIIRISHNTAYNDTSISTLAFNSKPKLHPNLTYMQPELQIRIDPDVHQFTATGDSTGKFGLVAGYSGRETV